jgi:hypothetical protein
MAMLHLTLRLYKIYHTAGNRQLPKPHSCMMKMCTIEYNPPPTNLLISIGITVRKPKFYNFCKEPDLVFGTWANSVSRNNITDSSQCPYITKPSAVSMFNGPFAKCFCPTHIPYWQEKNIWRYFSRLPYFYIMYEITFVTNITIMGMIRNFEVINLTYRTYRIQKNERK